MGYYSSYFLVLIAVAITAIASINVNTTFRKYSKISNMRGLTAAEVARQILDMNGLNYVNIERVAGNLTDHFDPKTNVVRLSDSTFNSTSVAALGVAAHECGHAVQYKENYFPMKVRAAIIPVTNFGSRLAVPLILFGLIIAAFSQGANAYSEFIVNLGIILYSFVVLFQLVTLPVEFNASGRAIKTMRENNILMANELPGAKKTLTAAALTYVAALLSSILTLLRLIAISRGGRRR